MHKDTFNADLFITAATVIPVLYLALTLQGQTYERVVNRLAKAMGKQETRREEMISYPLGMMYFAASAAIFTSGAIGEWLALWGLYNESASVTTEKWLILFLMVLIIAVVADPIIRFIMAARGTRKPSAHPSSPE